MGAVPAAPPQLQPVAACADTPRVRRTQPRPPPDAPLPRGAPRVRRRGPSRLLQGDFEPPPRPASPPATPRHNALGSPAAPPAAPAAPRASTAPRAAPEERAHHGQHHDGAPPRGGAASAPPPGVEPPQQRAERQPPVPLAPPPPAASQRGAGNAAARPYYLRRSASLQTPSRPRTCSARIPVREAPSDPGTRHCNHPTPETLSATPLAVQLMRPPVRPEAPSLPRGVGLVPTLRPRTPPFPLPARPPTAVLGRGPSITRPGNAPNPGRAAPHAPTRPLGTRP
mmetsp:Transcript_88277/g.196315  ORF Transcript_88277/g.196315 Transcript_88277/m.196315 type:complete len:283 (+) Transcript_88277:509-1357(+)